MSERQVEFVTMIARAAFRQGLFAGALYGFVAGMVFAVAVVLLL